MVSCSADTQGFLFTNETGLGYYLIMKPAGTFLGNALVKFSDLVDYLLDLNSFRIL